MITPFENASGLAGTSSLYYLARHLKRAVLVAPKGFSLKEASRALRYFADTPAVYSFPHFEDGYEMAREDPLISYERLSTQFELAENQNHQNFFVLTNALALSQNCLSPDRLRQFQIKITKGQEFDRDELIQKIKAFGYLQDELAQDSGVFSIRGFLLDLFSPFSEKPFRIEFFGDEIVSIRSFDSETQRSLEEFESITIRPCRQFVCLPEELAQIRSELKSLGDSIGCDRDEREHLLWQITNQREVMQTQLLLPALENKLCSLLDYLPDDMAFVFLNPEKISQELEESLQRDEVEYHNTKRLAYGPHQLRCPILDQIDKPFKLWSEITATAKNEQVLTFESLRPNLQKAKNLEPLKELIQSHHTKGIQTHLLFKSQKKSDSLRESLEELAGLVEWSHSELFSGFTSNSFGQAFITEQDIFGAQRKKKSLFKKVDASEFLREFSDLKDGDYIVHEINGLGRFRGLTKLEVAGVTSEFALIEYADEDKLYLPIYRLGEVSRYVRGDGLANIKLDRLGSQVFQRKRKKARDDILKIAHELIEVAAKRKLNKIERTSIDEELYQKFGESFAFELTPDQASCIEEIEKDLSRDYPMDRLVCGDVGFGKTEVAMRAAMFRLLQGKQVAVLAPTTLLVEQHFRGFQKRLKDFSFRVERLSRFVSAKELKATLEDLKNGKVDLIIGTHRLLQRDIKFKDLGLLVVDEEQRFGVKHKEKIKKLRATIDLLTLSATPIPRTLQMSIVGIRDLSLIVSPPEEREVVETKVASFDEQLIKNQVERELNRGGQVLFVHNRVKSIYQLEDKLKSFLPDCRIVVAHGQLHEDELEEKMIAFIEGQYDILLATSIIENGIDIPNANTLFVDRSDQFGLSDLYQLRGRVGRSNRRAYANFLIHDNKPLTLEASKRLQVIQSCTELGSGFKVASHDLEIRGSGNLLGEAQSGVVSEIGLELYNQMLHESLLELKHEQAPEPLPELSSGYSAFIPEDYLPDMSIRISTYRKIDRTPSLEALLNLEDEFLDRFGLYPPPVDNLFQLTRLKLMSAPLKAKSIDVYPGRISLVLSANTPLDPAKLIKKLGSQIQLDQTGKITFKFSSALRTPDLLQSTRFDTAELYDFSQGRSFLTELLKIAEIKT